MNESKPVASIVEKIAKECEEAGCSAWTVTKIVKEISKHEASSEATLREKTLRLLAKLDPAAAKVYASFQRMLVRTSRQTIEHFDMGNIIRSLLRETDVTRGVAEKIGREVEGKIKDLEISYISTALIREMVNVKLLEYGHESIRNQYARLGLPVFDVKAKIRQRPYPSKEVMTEYNLLRVIPRKLAEMHLRSDIFIASLEDFSTKPTAYCHTFESKASLNETIFSNLKRMHLNDNLVSWPINAANVNIALLPHVKRRTQGKAIELLLKAFEATFPNKENTPRYLGAALFVPEEAQGLDIDRDLLGKSANALLKESATLNDNVKVAISIDTKYKLKLLQKNLASKAILLNCKDKNLIPLNGIAAEKNICGVFGVNLVKAAAGNTENSFIERLCEQLSAVKELAELKQRILSKREYLKRSGILGRENLNCAALYGLASAAAEITKTQNEKDLQQFYEKTLSLILKELGEGFVVIELLNKTGIRRFEAENKRKEQPNLVLSLLKSDFILREMQVRIKAGNKKEASQLIDKGVKLIHLN